MKRGYISVSFLNGYDTWLPTSSSPPRPAPSRWCRSRGCRTIRLTPRSRRCGGTRRAAIRSARRRLLCRLRVPYPPPVQVQGLRQAVLRHQRHDLPRPQAGDPRLPDGHRYLRQRRQGHQRLAARPRPRRVLQDGVRAGPQAARGDGRRSGKYSHVAMSRSTAPTSAATASRRTSRPTGSTAA